MANLKEILKKNTLVYNTLTLAGQLAAEQDLELYVVGGVVRDILINRPLKEIDLMVVGDGIEFARLLAKKLGVRKIVPFSTFGTAQIPYKQIPVEVASARTESYQPDSRKPAQIKYTDLEGDLIRRDFTINAMAIDLWPERFGTLHDPFSGVQDLEQRLLITPLDPDETFAEDPLRMLRAAYFAANLGCVITDECLEAMKRQAERIKIVSWERVTAEIIKILRAPQPSVGFIILQNAGLLEYVFPEIAVMYGMQQPSEWHHKDVFHHTLQVVDNAAELSAKMELRFAALVHDIAKPVTRRIDPVNGVSFHGHDEIGGRMLYKIARRMKLSNEMRDYLQKMTRLHLRPIALAKQGITDSAIRRLMLAAGEDIDDLLTLCRADITTKNPNLVKRYMGNFARVELLMKDVVARDAMRAFQSPVRGDEIMEICGLKEGQLVGQLKLAIEEAILAGEIDNTYEAAREYLDRIKSDYL
ncbi:MAG: HD domain-containing protein [Candidatus Marinimicrobia bacterium]|nr:HD domain-containing protein [Candidatus Neomarinimicrobiota bacterium]